MALPARRVAIYPGTFDPLTNGHADIIRRGLSMFDGVIVAVAADTSKSPLFSLDERVAIASEVFKDSPEVEIAPFSGLLVEYAAARGVAAILRGLRAVSDYEYEFQIALMNRKLCPTIETVFLIANYRWLYISSTIIKTVASLGGDITGLVPDHVQHCLWERYNNHPALPPAAVDII